jgi:hypothetical protein
MPPCGHTGDALRGWSHSHLSPTNTLYPAGRYGSALAKLNSALTPFSMRWCVRKVLWSGWPTWFQTRASSCPPNVSKTPSPVLRKPYKWECIEECTLIPDLRSVLSSSPRQSTQNASSCRFYPTHAKNHYSHPNTCIAKLSIHTCLYTYIVVGQSRTE